MRFQFLCKQFGFSATVAIQLFPKTHAVVFMRDVAQFVEENIILQMFRQKGDVDIQADVVLARTTAPTGFLTAERGAGVRQIMFFLKNAPAGQTDRPAP